MKKLLLPVLAAALLAGCDERAFEAWDEDADGLITEAEMPAKLRDHFAGADFDGDGYIVRDEFEAASAYLRDPPRLRNFQIIHDIPYAGTMNPRQMLDLWLPKKATGRLPLIVYIHGGGWQQGDKSRGFLVAAPLLQSGRYIGASINYRLTDEATWPAQLHDCKAAIRWLRAHASTYGIDPDRIAVYGGSAGGHLAAMCGLTAGRPEMDGVLGQHTNVSTAVRCVVDYCGPTDLPGLLAYTNTFTHLGAAHSPETKLLGGRVADRLEAARAASPVTYITSQAPPFLIAQGTKDRIVPYNQSERLNQALLDAKVSPAPIFITLDGADHVFFSRALNQRTGRFLDLHLYGEASGIDTTPIKK